MFLLEILKNISWATKLLTTFYSLKKKKCEDPAWETAQDEWTKTQKAQNDEFIESELEKLGQNELDHKYSRLNSQR